MAMIVTSVALGILATSDGLPVNEWRIARSKLQPQVWLAAISTLSNALLAYAFAEGLAVNIWRTASSGTTVSTFQLNKLQSGCAVELLCSSGLVPSIFLVPLIDC
jgi:hypothetical protein